MFPKWMYHPKHPAKIIDSLEQLQKLGPGWSDTYMEPQSDYKAPEPKDVKPEPVPSPEPVSTPEPVAPVPVAEPATRRRTRRGIE